MQTEFTSQFQIYIYIYIFKKLFHNLIFRFDTKLKIRTDATLKIWTWY